MRVVNMPSPPHIQSIFRPIPHHHHLPHNSQITFFFFLLHLWVTLRPCRPSFPYICLHLRPLLLHPAVICQSSLFLSIQAMFATKFFFIIHLCLCVVPIIFATDQQIPLCSCSQASTCASEGSSQVENCKKECANYLAIYAAKEKADAEPLTGCFWMKSGLEGERMTKCMGAKIDNFCAASNSSNATLAKPDYCQWMESISNSTSAEDSAKSGGVFIRKARSAFIVFRSFQKCMNNCAKRHSTNCFNQAGCAVSLHSDQAKSLSIYNECTLQKVHKDAREACRCLIQKHKVYQLVGICPLMSNTYLMRMA